MEYHLRTKLNGNIAMTSCFHENSFLQRDRSLYKFIWVRHGALDVEVDHVVMHTGKRGNDFAYSFASCADKGSGR